MKSSSRKTLFFASAAVTNTLPDDNTIPIQPPSDGPTTVHLSDTTHESSAPANAAATKIQTAYRSHVSRTLVKKITAVDYEASRLERLIQRQETVDAVRSNERERIKISEALMALLLELDSVPGVNQPVRELRRSVSRRIVGLQEILDAVSDARLENWDGFLREWDNTLEGMEKEVCRERGGGHEMERFCAENLGFQCLQKFLRDQ